MWGPDLTIRAPYITLALKGGMARRRAVEVKHTHTHTHALRNTHIVGQPCNMAKVA